MTREDEVRAGLQEVRLRIDAAARAAGRTDDVRLVVVSKTFPASDVDILAAEGVTDVAENRDQEARGKHGECTEEARGMTWHMIGQVQRNKAASVARWADVVDSVDRVELVPALGRGARDAGRQVRVLLQVSLDPVPRLGRGGADPTSLEELAAAVAAQDGLVLAGVMGVAPHPGDPAAAFARLAGISERLRRDFPAATTISAGMSGDLEEAVAHGATQVRIGGAVLGSRGAV